MGILDQTFYAPSFKVKLDGSDVKPDLLRSITSITVTKQLGGSDYIKFDVQDRIENGSYVWLDSGALDIGKKINVVMGYADNRKLKAEAHIMTSTVSFTSSLPPVFSVEGSHQTFNRLNKMNEILFYKEKTDSDMVKDIAKKAGLSVKAESTTYKYPMQKTDGKKTFMEFIKEIADRNAGYEYFVFEGKLNFRKADISSSPLVTLIWGQHLTKFSPTINLDKMITGVKYHGAEDKTNLLGEAKAGAEKKIDSKGTLGSVEAKNVGEKIVEVRTSLTVKAELQALANAHLERITADYVTASSATVGIPELIPGSRIELKGLGKKFSGKYYITKTTHTIDGGGYKTDLQLRRNTL